MVDAHGSSLYLQAHSASLLTWFEGLWPFGTQSAFIRWTEWILAIMTAPETLSSKLSSVLWYCWLDVWKSIRPVKNRLMRCWHGYLSGMRCRWFAYGPADVIASTSSLASLNPDWFILSGACLCCPRKEVVKRVSVYYCSADDWSDKASENSSTNDEGGSGMEADTDVSAPAASKPKKPSKTQHVAAIRKNHLNIVFIGHVGKSLFDCLLPRSSCC